MWGAISIWSIMELTEEGQVLALHESRSMAGGWGGGRKPSSVL